MDERELVERVVDAGRALVEAFAEESVPREVVRQEVRAVLFGERELHACHVIGLITDEEYVNAVAAHLVTLALVYRRTEPPFDQRGRPEHMARIAAALWVG